MHQTLNFGFGLSEIDGISGQSGGWVGRLACYLRLKSTEPSD